MKYIKTYENLKKIEIGDYVAINSSTSSSAKDIQDLHVFLNTHIGQVVDKTNTLNSYTSKGERLLVVKYDHNEIPRDFIGFFRNWFIEKDLEYYYTRKVLPKDVIFKSKNKKDVEIFLKSKEYNI